MSATGRSGARQLALQALYQLQLSGHELPELQSQFHDDPEWQRCEQAHFDALLEYVCQHRDELDAHIGRYGDIGPAQLDPVEHAVLWIGLAELQSHPDVPVPVVLDQAVELAKRYGAEGGHKYVNGLLDKAARDLRPAA